MARRFASTNDYIGDFATVAATTAMSVYGWVKNPSASGRIATHAQWIFLFDASQRIQLVREWASGTAIWHGDMTGITLANYNHYAITYDGASSANDPLIYINNQPVAVTEDAAPVGANVVNTTSVWALGNRASGIGAANLGGDLDWFGWHNAVLTQAQLRDAMNFGSSPVSQYRIVQLAGRSPELDTAGNTTGAVNGSTVVAAPSIQIGPGAPGLVAAAGGGVF